LLNKKKTEEGKGRKKSSFAKNRNHRVSFETLHEKKKTKSVSQIYWPSGEWQRRYSLFRAYR